MIAATMNDASLFQLLRSPQFDAVGDYRPELPSWNAAPQALTRVTLSPVYCGTSAVKGYMIMGLISLDILEYFDIL